MTDEAKEGIVETDDSRRESLWTKILAHQHACLTGANASIQCGLVSPEPKQVRNGLDAAFVSHGALVKLLISKGIFKEIEYFEALLEMWEIEHKRYETDLSAKMGRKITLG